MGFFSEEEKTRMKRATPTVARCNICGVYRGCKTPKMPVTGEGRKGVLIVAEAPGREEDKRGVQLIGQSGQLLRTVLDEIGVDLDRDCWKTNSVVCWPGEGNPTPSQKRIQQCRPNLIKTIKELEPKTIILLGGTALSSLIGYLWSESPGSISMWAGFRIPDREFNTWICPTFHPAYLLRSNGDPALRLWFKRHLAAAFRKKGKPWKTIPDWRKDVQILYDSRFAVGMLEGLLDYPNHPIAFDYETTMLKPDGPEAKIVSCAVAWEAYDGVRAISYLWRGVAVKATRELLRSEVPKIAANLKFEERWTRKEFGHGVRNWKWDTMQAAHVLDGRPGITGLKFQAYVQFGQPSYDDKVGPYLKSAGSNEPNRIHEVDPKELLLYGGLDSLLEFRLAKLQMKRMGISLQGA